MSRDFNNSLRISEIFYSIQGESTTIGLPTVFIRLTGCPLRCQYCDSEYAFSGGKVYSIESIVKTVFELFGSESTHNKYITITGGEPLAQKACTRLISTLLDMGFKVSIETSGAFPVDDLDPRLMIVMDLKTPDSKEVHRNLYSNIDFLKPTDQVKFVICSQEDYDWSKQQVIKYELDSKCEVLFSPSFSQMNLKDLANNILSDKLNVRLQTQLHKHIWGDIPGV